LKKINVDEKIKRTIYSVTALALCIVTLFSFWYANKSNENFIPENDDEASQNVTVTQKDIQVNTPVTNVPDDRYNEITTQAPVTKSVEFDFPLKNSVTKSFSNDELVKNATTGDWRIHKGIDITGASGDRINAVSDGIVTEMVDSALWGTVITVDHGNGYIAKYCGLRKGSTVKSGDELKSGDKIGLLDEIPLESDDGIHLHFELYKDGKAVSPSEYLGKTVDIS
jgi:murein DD-endopeptidase MepM/ murein hydrolase activator NlpD